MRACKKRVTGETQSGVQVFQRGETRIKPNISHNAEILLFVRLGASRSKNVTIIWFGTLWATGPNNNEWGQGGYKI